MQLFLTSWFPLVFSTLTFVIAVNSEIDMKIDFPGLEQLTAYLNQALRNPYGNSLHSPTSIQASLTAAWIASQKGSNTSKEIYEINNVHGGFLRTSHRVNDFLKSTSNTIYVNKRFQLNAQRKEAFTAPTHLRAQDVYIEMFDGFEVAKMANEFVAQNTNDRIKDIFNGNNIDDDTTAIWLSTTKFQVEWTTPFEAFGSDIFSNQHASIAVPFMYQRGKFLHGDLPELDAIAIEIPINVRKTARMLVLMPNKLNGLEELCDRVYEADFGKIQKYLKKKEVLVFLPQLKEHIGVSMIEPFKKINMTSAFKPTAEFNKLLNSGQDNYIRQFRHHAFVKFDTKGIEAVSATSIQWELVSENIPIVDRSRMKLQNEMRAATSFPPTIVQVNHPFIFVLLEKAKRRLTRVWFVGTVKSVTTE